MSDNAILLETEVSLCAEKCAEYCKEHGVDNPDLLVEYGKALFRMAKSTASLVNPENQPEQLPVVHENIDIPEIGGDEEEEEEENGEEGNEDAEGDEEDNDDDFTAAFEVLDAARVLYSKMEQTEDVKKKLINVRQLLGDVSLEDDNPQQAVEDFLAAIELKKEVYGASSGEVGVSEYTLSLAYDALGDRAKSVDHLRNAVKCAKEAKLPSAETLELKLKDMEEETKIASKLKGKDEKLAKKATLEGIVGRSAVESAVKSLVANANDISNLTRKRKRSAEPESQPASSKKKNE